MPAGDDSMIPSLKRWRWTVSSSCRCRRSNRRAFSIASAAPPATCRTSSRSSLDSGTSPTRKVASSRPDRAAPDGEGEGVAVAADEQALAHAEPTPGQRDAVSAPRVPAPDLASPARRSRSTPGGARPGSPAPAARPPPPGRGWRRRARPPPPARRAARWQSRQEVLLQQQLAAEAARGRGAWTCARPYWRRSSAEPTWRRVGQQQAGDQSAGAEGGSCAPAPMSSGTPRLTPRWARAKAPAASSTVSAVEAVSRSTTARSHRLVAQDRPREGRSARRERQHAAGGHQPGEPGAEGVRHHVEEQERHVADARPIAIHWSCRRSSHSRWRERRRASTASAASAKTTRWTRLARSRTGSSRAAAPASSQRPVPTTSKSLEAEQERRRQVEERRPAEASEAAASS